MHESWKHYAKKKPVIKDHRLYDFMYLKSPKMVNAQKRFRDEGLLLHNSAITLKNTEKQL